MLKVGAIVFAVVVATQSPIQKTHSQHYPPENPTTQPTRDSDNHQRGTESSPFAVKLMNAGKSESEAAQDNAREEKKSELEEWASEWTIALTFGLVLVGLIQALAIIYTALVTNKAANAAQASAEAALSQLRAVLTIKSVTLEGASIGKIPRAAVTFENTGQTPAFNYTQVAVMGVDLYPEPIKLPEIGDVKLRQSQPIGAGSEIIMHVNFSKPLQAHHIEGLKNKTMAIYVVGKVAYLDAFKTHHMYEFALFSNAEGGWPMGQMAAFIGDTTFEA